MKSQIKALSDGRWYLTVKDDRIGFVDPRKYKGAFILKKCKVYSNLII